MVAPPCDCAEFLTTGRRYRRDGRHRLARHPFTGDPARLTPVRVSRALWAGHREQNTASRTPPGRRGSRGQVSVRRSVGQSAAAARGAGARLDQGVQDRFDVREPGRSDRGSPALRPSVGDRGGVGGSEPRGGPLPADLARAGPGRRQDEIASSPWNRSELGTQSFAYSSSPSRSRVYGATSSDHRVGVATTGPSRIPRTSRALSALAPATAGRLTAQGARPPVASMTGAVGRWVHHQRTMRSSVVAASRPGSKGCAPGTAQSGSGQAQPRPPLSPRGPACAVPTPGSTGHCHTVAQVRAASSRAVPSLRRSRSLRRLPRISRMSARSFPLNAEST